MASLQKHPLEERSLRPIPQTEVNQALGVNILVDGTGVPIDVSVDGDNRHDMKMSNATLQ
jgi:hypothetical protein